MAEKKSNPLDINGQNFNPNLYLEKLFKVLQTLFLLILYLANFMSNIGEHLKASNGS